MKDKLRFIKIEEKVNTFDVLLSYFNREQENLEKSDTESFAEVSESDLIALALSPNGEGANGTQKLVSLPSDSTLNSVSLTEVDGIYI